MIISLISGLALSEGISLLIEGSALAITTFYTAKSTKKSATKGK